MSDKLIEIPKCKINSTSLVIADGTTLGEWKKIGSTLRTVQGAIGFWIGDWLKFGEDHGYISSEKYDAAEKATGLDRQTLADMAWVANKVPSSSREEDVSFAHHKVVAPLDPKDQVKFLHDAVKNDLTRDELREKVKVYRHPDYAPPLSPAPLDPHKRTVELLTIAWRDVANRSRAFPEFAGLIEMVDALPD